MKRLRFYFTVLCLALAMACPAATTAAVTTPDEPTQELDPRSTVAQVEAKAIAAGSSHTCALTSTGAVKCWGANGFGQIGDGTTANRSMPVDVIGLSVEVSAISTGGSHTCVVASGGALKCWGGNGFGQLGDGTWTNRNSPSDVLGLWSGVSAISAAGGHTCAVTSVGGVKCWGYNGFGQLGDGTTTQRFAPVDVSGLTEGMSKVNAGASHTCALTNTGGVKCWGNNSSGQLGDGTTTQRFTPVDVGGLSSGVSAIAASSNHTCALTNVGGVKCWGSGYGSLPMNVSGLLSGVTKISAGLGDGHSCALITGGGVKCWGSNTYGQLGDGTNSYRIAPVDVSSLSNVNTVGVGGAHTCAITNGSVKCWGSNLSGQLGNGNTGNSSSPRDVTGLGNGVSAISTGNWHTCAAISGSVKCWGNNGYGQLGDGTQTNRSTPIGVSGLSNTNSISAGGSHTCALTAIGGVKCWGEGRSGQIGDGANVIRWTPVDVSGLSSGVNAVSTGSAHTCALTIAGGVKCWGANYSGQLGDGTTADRSLPIDVSGLIGGVMAITTSGSHTCALMTTGGVKCWGANVYGQLGDGTTTDRSLPTDVNGLASGVGAISASPNHTCALITGGSVKCWGNNVVGALGDGTIINRTTPVTVIGLSSDVSAISAGHFHTCALTNIGGVKCWGSNAYGQLGNGSVWFDINNYSVTPVEAVGLTSGISAIRAGYGHTCALTNSGGVKCWGDNSYGKLGDGTVWQTTPVDVVGFGDQGSTPSPIIDLIARVNPEPGKATLAWSERSEAVEYEIRYSAQPLTEGNWANATKLIGVPVPGQPNTPREWSPNVSLSLSQRWFFAIKSRDAAGQWSAISNMPSIMDTGYRPAPSGYKFQNWAHSKTGNGDARDEYSVNDMRRMFGDWAVCQGGRSSCLRLNPDAENWRNTKLKDVNGGHCLGMSITSLRFFFGPDTPSLVQSGASTTQDLNFSLPARRYITYYHLLQYINPVGQRIGEALEITPADSITRVLSARSPANLIMISPDRKAGHAVTPYALQDNGYGIWLLAVYDNNHPNRNDLYVYVNARTNNWYYDIDLRTEYSGSVEDPHLGVLVNTDAGATNLICPWCVVAGASQVQEFALGGSLQGLVTDSSGRQLGPKSGIWTRGIPGAYALPNFGGLGKSGPRFVLPITDTYQIDIGHSASMQARPSSASVNESSSLSIVGPNYSADMTNLLELTSGSSRISVGQMGKQLGYHSGGRNMPDFMMSLHSPSASYKASIAGVTIEAGHAVTVTADEGNGQLVFDSSSNVDGSYDLRIDRVTDTDQVHFFHADVPSTLGDTHYVKYEAWNGTGVLTVSIDRGSDGIIDTTLTLENQANQIYIPLAQRQ